MPNLYDLFSTPDTEVALPSSALATVPPRPPKPKTTMTAAAETTDADRAAMLLGALGL